MGQKEISGDERKFNALMVKLEIMLRFERSVRGSSPLGCANLASIAAGTVRAMEVHNYVGSIRADRK